MKFYKLYYIYEVLINLHNNHKFRTKTVFILIQPGDYDGNMKGKETECRKAFVALYTIILLPPISNRYDTGHYNLYIINIKFVKIILSGTSTHTSQYVYLSDLAGVGVTAGTYRALSV